MTMIQINGVRCHQMKFNTRDRKEIEKLVLNEYIVKKTLRGRAVRKVIIVKDKLVNILADKAWSNKNYYPITGE